MHEDFNPPDKPAKSVLEPPLYRGGNGSRGYGFGLQLAGPLPWSGRSLSWVSCSSNGGNEWGFYSVHCSRACGVLAG